MAAERMKAGPRRRFDAAALTALLASLVLGLAIGTSRCFDPSASSWFGPAGESLAAIVVNTLGMGSVVCLIGWTAWWLRYALGASWLKLTQTAIGWGILGLSTAALADYGSAWFQGIPVSPFGKGGSLGAWCRFSLDTTIPAPTPWIVVICGNLLGLTLVSAVLVRYSILGIGGTVQSLSRMISGSITPQAKNLRTKTRETVVELTPVAPAVVDPTETIPIVRHTELTDTQLPPESDPAEETPATDEDPVSIPIHRHSQSVPREHPEPESDLPEGYELPPLSLLSDADAFPQTDHEQRLRDRAALLEKTFLDFDLKIKVVGIHTGPVITQYEISLETGLRLNKVTILADDLALNLGVASVRIVAPLPGRNTVGIEVPNDHRQTVRLKELILASVSKQMKFKLPVFLGKDVEGRPLVYDMADMPHLLIAGRTGTGKSVCLNAILNSFLFTRRPDECRLLLIDPKKVEFSEYGRIPHLMHPVVTDDKKAEAILAWAVDKMEERYEQLRKARVRNVASYNELGWEELVRRVDPQNEDERKAIPRKMPYIVLVVDEVGDLLMTMKKEVETHIIRLAQKSRAAGIHLILATQRPTVDVITGLIKSNLPARICFQVASRADSAVVLDEKGAEKLLGQGDMLFLQPRTSTIIRGQGTYVDDREIERTTEALAEYEPNFESELLNLKTKDQPGGDGDFADRLRDRDPLYEQAIDVVVREQRGSTSLLQRALGIGYGRASRLIDFMAEDGIVGGFNGSNARDVLVTSEDWEARKKG